ncbi:GNAT family N-acetyltransferase [Ammonicoccus fulvus]|uniref:GNAT family N-acetyltransferase n=1 Tax=Ammonicoccus fulvus TaxID=3138240 RepID=A0ABZ3FN37_9ACTN
MGPQLVAPHVRYFDSWQESHAEWAGAHQDGASVWLAEELGLDLTRPDDFDAWAETLLIEADPSYPVPASRVHATTLWIVEDGHYLGAVNLRHRLDEFLEAIGGHIGYGIRPSARRRGLATLALDGALARAVTLGLDRVLITCHVDNAGSRRTIERAGGVLTGIRQPDDFSRSVGFDYPMRRYEIDLTTRTASA